jgi:hypothetical protein
VSRVLEKRKRMKGGDLDGLVAHLIGRMRAAKPVVKSTIGWVRRIFGANGFHFGKGQIFPVLRRGVTKAKVGLQALEKREFSGFACSGEQAKRRRKPGETRLLA